MKEELVTLYNEVGALKDVTEMIKDSKVIESAEAKAFNEGSNFAYKNVLKLIEERYPSDK